MARKAKTSVKSTKTVERDQFEKDYTALKYYLIGKEYYTALRALGYAEGVHTGLRKDGKTPELHHQVRICFTLIGLRGIQDEEAVLTAAILHDTVEDYDVPLAEIVALTDQKIANAVWRLDKRNKADLTTCPIASIVKGADNADNTLTMAGVFSHEKSRAYIARTKAEILPMLKKASKRFPLQQVAYASIGALLKKQIALNETFLTSVDQEQRIKNLQASVMHERRSANSLRDEVDRLKTSLEMSQRELNYIKATKLGDRALKVIAISELYKEVIVKRPNADAFKTVFEILINKWNLHPSFLTLLDDEKLDVDSVLRRL